MAAKVTFDSTLCAVISRSEPDITRDSMSETGREIAAQLAAHDCSRLLVDMKNSRMNIAVEDTTIIMDRLMNSLHGQLSIAIVINDGLRAHFDHIADYLQAGMIDVEEFTDTQSAADWLTQQDSGRASA